ncbi:TonB-dependent receptor plug domain-containing protein [Pelagicoccus mobilis]|uniref:TonB-dependent receptor plug domain-containing protein n=1 Tax=Pelagicoccus mobilis TaxID=415221 RepID=A0A934RVN7_9BACT|nr:TonB-dependent receptor plug domain-containing protein [Pelagicoccus mobilis]MBK1875277.1 TonB-dependent receptor plug domain-containing protein [Pelagicoccus mobilis]
MDRNIIFSKPIGRIPTFVLGLALSSVPLSLAQDDDESDEVFELSPFVITGEENVGYRATSTLAGTRIKTEMKDLGSAIQVVTEEFLEDTGATGAEDILLYTTGTEIGGPDGNYSGTNVGDGARFNDDEARRNPQASARVRGVTAPNYTRNYFSTNIPIDSYNTSGITISRGPNSLLFGLGSAGGVIDNSARMPVIGEESNKLTYRYGSHGSNRATFDIVRTVIEDRLAVKVSGLYKQTNYRQEPAFDRDKRAYFAFTAKLFKNEGVEWLGATTLRGNAEVGEGKRTPPASLVPGVSWESFFVPPQDFRPYNGVDYPGLGYDGFAASWEKWGTIDTREQPDGTPGYNENSTVPGEFPLYSTPFFFTSPITMFQQDGSVAIAQDGSGIGGFANWANKQPTPNGASHRPDLFVNTRAYEEGNQGLAFKAPSLPSRDIFDYRNHLLTGGLQNVTRDFDAQTVFLEQSLFNGKGGVELAFDRQHYNTEYYQPFGGGGRAHSIYIDTSEYLIGGMPNPNVGRAFITNYYTFDSDERRVTKRDNQRLTAYYEHDFSDMNEGLGKYLGKHRFTGLIQTEERHNINSTWGKFVDGVGFTSRGGNDVGWGRMVAPLYYISGDLRGVEQEDVRLSALPSNTIQDVTRFSARYLLDPNNSHNLDENGNPMLDGDGNVIPGWEDRDFRIVRRARGGGTDLLEVDSEAFAWQSYFLDGHVVGLLGIRDDEVTTTGRLSDNEVRELGIEPRFPGNEVNLDARHILGEPNPSQEATTRTYSVVAHAPRGWVENLPVSSVSAHWSEAENFQAISQGRDNFNNLIGNPEGETTELGFSVGFADDKWLLRVNYFETTQINSRTANGPKNSSISWHRNFLNRWQQGINDGIEWSADSPNDAVRQAAQAGWTSYDHIISDIISLQPEPARSLYDYALNDDGDEWVAQGEGIQGLVATREISAEGWEFELVGNPTENWRVSVNATQVEATPTNTAQALQDYSNMLLDNMAALGMDNPLILEGAQSIVGIKERWGASVATPVAGIRARDDTNSQELREWSLRGVSNYVFTDGRLKGGSIGGAVRYSSKVGIGNGLVFDQNGVPIPDVNNIFYGPSETSADMWAAYSKKITDDINWKIQLNVRNVIGGGDETIPVFANPDGRKRIYRVAPETSWFLTNTFTF